MKKLVQGIVDFRRKVRDEYRETFAQLALGQSPDALFIACSDSRVVPNTFASTNPGDLFVVRNVGNIIPVCGDHGVSVADESEAAAIEFSILNLNVSDIIICGHSECGAMRALIKGRGRCEMTHLRSWLRHAEPALDRFNSIVPRNEQLPPHDRLSQLNVLLQMENVKSYPAVRERIKTKSLRIHGWWFDIRQADVYAYSEHEKGFVLIDEKEAEKLLARFS